MFSDNFGRKRLSKKTKDTIFLFSHKTILYSALIGLFLLFFSLDSFAVDWYDSAWSYRKKITIDHTKVTDVATPSTTYANFPVLVNLTGLTNVTDANGGDIRFTSSDGTTELAREIVNFSAGTLYAYVKVTLTKDSGDSTDDVIYIYYGNSGATEPSPSSTYGKYNTWDSDFTAVLHLTETSGQHLDSTSNNLGSMGAWSVTDQGDAPIQKIFGADQFVAANEDLVYLQLLRYYINNVMIAGTDQGTIEVWMYPTGASPSDDDIRNLAPAWSDNWEMGGVYRGEYPAGSGIDRIWVKGGGAEIPITYTVDEWVKITWVFESGTTLRAYKNGTEISSASGSATATAGFFTLGNPKNSSWGFFTGNIDEVRTSDIPRPAEWIATSYQNENAPTSGGFFSAVGSEDNDFTWDGSTNTDWDTTANWDVNAVAGSGHDITIPNVTNKPVLATAVTVNDLTINSSSSLDLNGNNLTVGGTYSNEGTLQLNGDEGTVSLTMDIDSGTVIYIGNGDGTQDTHTIKDFGTPDYFNLTINDANVTKDIYQLGAGLGVVGDLTVTSGTLNYNSKTLTLSGANKNYTIGTDGLVNGSGGTTNITGSITYTDDTGGSQNIGDLNVN